MSLGFTSISAPGKNGLEEEVDTMQKAVAFSKIKLCLKNGHHSRVNW